MEKYVIYPHEEIQVDLTPQDKLIYLAIRRYMNKDSLTSYPSYARITEDIGAAAKTIKKSVDNLVKAGYLETKKDGRKIIYKFNNKKKFEPFSYSFLDKPDLSFTEKSYIVASQQYMFKDEDTEEGRISYTNKELSNIIKMSESTISRCNHSLEKKGYLEGASEQIKRFQLRELDQMIIWKLKEHEDRINQNSEDIKELKKQLKEQQRIIDKLMQNKPNTYVL